jgi:hypothetical protein
MLWRQFNLSIALCESAPCARQTYGAEHPGVAVAHRVRSHRQAPDAAKDGAMPKADAKRGPALSPQRFGRVAQRFEVPAVYPRRLSRNDAPRAFGLIPTPCCGRYQAILFGLLFSWASKRKVTRAAAAARNARRAGGTLASTRQPNTEARDDQPFDCWAKSPKKIPESPDPHLFT